MYGVYEVKPGETLRSIGNKLRIDPNTLSELNNLMVDEGLRPNSYIVIPASNNNDTYGVYIVKKGDNLYDIARRYGINEDLLAGLNGINKNNYIYPDEKLLVPREGTLIYMTKENDTLNGVSNKLSVNREELINENESMFLLPNQFIIYKKEKNR